jgi:hypothetical protein
MSDLLFQDWVEKVGVLAQVVASTKPRVQPQVLPKKKELSWGGLVWRLLSVIPATQKAEIGRMEVQG